MELFSAWFQLLQHVLKRPWRLTATIEVLKAFIKTGSYEGFLINPLDCEGITTMHESLYISICYGDFLITTMFADASQQNMKVVVYQHVMETF
ncbi:hypothetical protein MTBBW1_990011 [Desulfamplus magnetovallimortis]|uniref:Uncharacterized protein n=1 Tax=Desulfamplus magnetovallimortis TaxID=1246637 RepID=A0A1W1HLQ7_9BACT|nr:hypothetical protein MTBBW1_990011 [Desulfamplus magnetovallimortis]